MAATEKTETSNGSYTSDAKAVGTSFSIDGTYIAGGGQKKGTMGDKGIKFRTSKNGNTIVFDVAEGYRILKIDFDGYANHASNTLVVSDIKVDGSSIGFSSTKLSQNDGSTKFSTGDISAEGNITLYFTADPEATTDATKKMATQAAISFTVTYIQEQVIVQEVTALAIGGVAISADQLASFKSNKTLEVDASNYNGLPSVVPTLSSGSTTVSCKIEGTTAEYTFTINSTEEYTVKLTNISRTYIQEGSVIAYKEGSTEVTGANTNTVTMNGITFTMVDAAKTFQYGTGQVTLGQTTYTPLKLSTGSAVNVTFPEGKVATKVIVYGWSASNNGKLYCFQETSDANGKKVDVSSDVFLSGNNAYDIYPSVFEYDLDNWTSAYFSAGGSPSQPFVVMDFVLEDAPAANGVTVEIDPEIGYATFYDSEHAVKVPAGVTPYVFGMNLDYELDLVKYSDALMWDYGMSFDNVIPAGVAVVLQGANDAVLEYVAAEEDEYPVLNYLLGTDEAAPTVANFGGACYFYALTLNANSDPGSVGLYWMNENGAAFTNKAHKAYLALPTSMAGAGMYAKKAYLFNKDATAIKNVDSSANSAKGQMFNIAGQRVNGSAKGIIIKNGKKMLVK